MAHRVLSLPARYGIGGDVVDGYGALPQGRGTQLPCKNSLGSADFLHSLPWLAVAVGASDAGAEE